MPKSQSMFQFRSELLKLLKLSGSITVIALIEHLMVLTDLAVVGRLGVNEFAAVGLAGMVFSLLIVTSLAVLAVISVFVAEDRSRNAGMSTGYICGHGFWIVCALAVPFVLLIYFLSSILAFAGVEADVIPFVLKYCHALVLAIPFALIFIWMREYLAGTENILFITCIAILAVPANLLLNLVLVLGIGIEEGYGVSGAGIATTLINFTMAAVTLGYIILTEKQVFLEICRGIRTPNFCTLKRIWRIGSYQAVITMLENGMFAVAAVLVGTFSVAALAAHNVVFALLEIGILFAVGIGEGAMVRVAYHSGNNDRDSCRAVMRMTLSLSVVVLLALVLILFNSSVLISSLLVTGSAAQEQAVEDIMKAFLLVATLSLFFDGIQTVLNRILRATKDEHIPVLIAATGYWVFGVGCAWLLGVQLEYEVLGIWTGLMIGFFVTSVMMFLRLTTRLKQIS